ncbi:kinase-like domain-containing protein [Mycena haematopus]|nr:kinase-like domain-containing protein [Mycena haematopus]
MAPELIDPDRFGRKFLRTPATDIYAFGCVCLELYTGQPPFATLSETASLLRIINGDRPERPASGKPMLSDVLWEHINGFWAQDSAERPAIDAVVHHMRLNYAHDTTNEKAAFSRPWRQFYKAAPSVTDPSLPPPSDTDIMEKMRQFVSHDDPRTIYSVIRKVGPGWFGPIFRATELATGRSVAIAQNDMAKQQKYLFFNQISVMKEFQHPNIISFVASYLVEPEQLWIVTDYIEGCKLTEVIRNNKIIEDQASNICLQTCKGLAYLHSQRVIHRDIRASNILVDSTGRVKIVGFGYCAKLTSQRPRRASMAGTPHWMAPEILRQEIYGVEVDVWSLGIMVIELTRVENERPYMNEELLTVFYRIAANGTPTINKSEAPSSELDNFLTLCLCVDATHRATADELVTHPFLQKACDLAGLAPLFWFQKSFWSKNKVIRKSPRRSEIAEKQAVLEA